jgi:hypothetical protein
LAPGQSSSINIGNTFGANIGLTAPPLGVLWNFTDVYTFVTTPATASVNTITFNFGPEITKLQVALFSSSQSSFSTFGSNLNTAGTASGAVAGGGWASNVVTPGPLFNVVTLSNVNLNPAGAYTMEIRGLAPVLTSGSASYSGNFLLSAVPEPETYALFFAGLLGIGMALQRRARD